MGDLQAIADRLEIEALRGEFTERVYEVRYEDTTPLAGSPPPAAQAPTGPPPENPAAAGGARE